VRADDPGRMRAWGLLVAVAVLAAVAVPVRGSLAAFLTQTANEGSTFATAASFSTCPNTSMTAAYLTGLEFGRRPFKGESIAIVSPGTVDSAVKRSGGYSMKIAPSGTSVYGMWTNAANTSTTVQVARFALYLDSLPAGDVNQLFGMSSAGGLALRYVAATQKLALAIKPSSAGTAVVATSDVAVQAQQWYVIEVRYRVASPTHIADWRIDGSPQPSASVPAAASTTNTTYFGTAQTVPDTFAAHYDDIVISADSGAYPLGDGRVYGLLPNGVSTGAAAGVIKDDDGTDVDTTSWQRLDEVPMLPITDFIQQTVASTSAYVDISLQDTTQTCIRAAHGYYTTHSAASTKTNHVKISVLDGAAESILLNGSSLANSTSPRDGSAPVSPATTWSQGALNGLVVRFGQSTSVANEVPKLDGVMVEYEVPQ
jgi:hypothetical protein